MLTNPIENETKTAKVSVSILFFALSVLVIDQITKYFVYHHIDPLAYGPYIYPYGGIGIFKNFFGISFSINHMTNTGAAWGFLGGYQIPLLVLRIGLILGTIVYLFYYNKNRLWQFPLLLILAGAIGNVLDYFVYGHVIDMFHFVLWGFDFPVFNVADIAISCGIFILFFLSWFE